MAKTSSQPRGRGNSKPAKATARIPVASRAKPGPQGDGHRPELKAVRTKAAERRIEPPALKAATAPKARVSAPPWKVKRSPPHPRGAERRQPTEIRTAPAPAEPTRSAAPAAPPATPAPTVDTSGQYPAL